MKHLNPFSTDGFAGMSQDECVKMIEQAGTLTRIEMHKQIAAIADEKGIKAGTDMFGLEINIMARLVTDFQVCCYLNFVEAAKNKPGLKDMTEEEQRSWAHEMTGEVACGLFVTSTANFGSTVKRLDAGDTDVQVSGKDDCRKFNESAAEYAQRVAAKAVGFMTEGETRH